MLPDARSCVPRVSCWGCLNAPTGAWCSLTIARYAPMEAFAFGLNAPTGAWCSLTGTPMFILNVASRLNAPTGAWCSLTRKEHRMFIFDIASQCTYRCVVLPDKRCVLDRELYHGSQCTYRCVVLPDPCPRERRYDATSRARSATGPGNTPPDRPAPGSD